MNPREQTEAALALYDKIRNGEFDAVRIREKVLELAAEGFWNYSQVGAITGYDRHTVADLMRGAVRSTEPFAGGTLDPRALEALVELQRAVGEGAKPSHAVLAATIRTGTGTRLISKLTGIPLGSVLYAQRKLQKETSR